jgi:hypothetical protein
MRDKSGGGMCATCCHSASVAGHFQTVNSRQSTKQKAGFSTAGGCDLETPEQAVLTGLGELPEPLSHRG